jgi:transcriptional regulator GlxA family with amidase domain
VRHLHERCAEPVAIDHLAEIAGLSASHLQALFRRRFGCGAHRYQAQLRVERACALLMNPYLAIEAVAERCGFADANYFARVFRAATGASPRAWRKRKLGKA